MNTRWPSPRATIGGEKARASRMGARRLMSSARSTCSTLYSATSPDAGMPALATRTSTSPASSTRAPSSERSARSQTIARPPTSSRNGSSTSARRPVSNSLAPRAASARATAWPRPPVAPVTSTVFPAISTREDCQSDSRPRAATPRRRYSAAMARAEVIAIFGPTGVGKTAIALALAERLRARGECPVAISADALQVYAGLETLTGAPTAAEQATLEHRLVSCVAVQESFSAGRYAALAHAEIDAALAHGGGALLVGGPP